MNNNILICEICGYKSKQLFQHLKAVHNLSVKEYRNIYGGDKIVQIGFSPPKKEFILNKTISGNVKKSYQNSITKLNSIDKLYSKKEVRNILNENDYYLKFIGRTKQRTLLKENPKLFKSIYAYTDELKNYFKLVTLPTRLKYIVDYNYNIEKFKCPCGRKYTLNKYCRNCEQAPNKLPHKNRKCSEETKKKIRLNLLKRIEETKGPLSPRYNIHSIDIIENYGLKHGYTFQHAENGGKYYIKELGYWVDGYDKENNVVIEIDERHHFNKDGTLSNKDIIRQKEIEELLKCKFIRVKYNPKYQILTPTGFQNFSGIKKIIKPKYLHIEFDDNSFIDCSLEHRFLINNVEIYADKLKVGNILDTRTNKKIIKEITIIKEEKELYDILNVSNGNIFYANDIVSHNCDVSFTSSGETIIDGEIISWYEQHENIIEPILKKLKKKFFQYTKIDPNKSYIISADVARGDGTDSSTFHILDADTLEQCGEFKDQLPPTEFALLLYSVAKEWNNALLIVENTGLGWSVIEKLIELDYENLYYSIKGNPHPDPNMYLRKGVDLFDNDAMVPGFSNTAKSRPLIIEKFISVIENKEVIIRSKRLINEIKVFVWKNGKAQARSGYNDDLIMAYAIGVFVQAYALKIKQASLELTKATLNNFGKDVKEQQEQVPLVFSSGYNRNNPWKMPVQGNHIEDLKWLVNK